MVIKVGWYGALGNIRAAAVLHEAGQAYGQERQLQDTQTYERLNLKVQETVRSIFSDVLFHYNRILLIINHASAVSSGGGRDVVDFILTYL